LAALLVILAVPTLVRADRLDEAWRRGNEAYLRGDYPGAVAAYQELDRQGVVSADLYYNLGDAHFRRGAVGRAIWSFERALVLDPNDEDARYNLEQARKVAARAAKDRIEGADREPAWIRLVTAVDPSAVAWAFALCYVGFFVLLGVRRVASADRRAPLAAAAAILGVGAALAGALVFGRSRLDQLPFGVVLPDAAAVKEGADVNYRTSFDVHAGLRVRLVEQDQDWLRIRLANGLEGWVRADDVGRL
jgi:tetratricopeptide (TPR) repeat protein